MMNMIVIRGNKIAFSKFPGDYGDQDHIAFDMLDMFTSYGLFIPIATHGVQVIPMLRRTEEIFEPHNQGPSHFSMVKGLKGVLVTPSWADEVSFHNVRLTADLKISTMPLFLGQRGFAVMTPYDHFEEIMTMCIRLTETIEESLDMFCRHVAINRNHIEVRTKAEMKQLIKVPYTNFLKKEEAAMAAFKKEEAVVPDKI